MEKYSRDAYRRKVEAIFTRYPSVQKVPFGDAYKPGLEHMLRFAAILGNPHDRFRTIHVAGTNGKGSVASMLASVLSAACLRTGLYTSPHIEDFRERARILSPVAGGASTGSATASHPVGEPVEPPELIPEDYVYDFLCRYEADMDSLDLSFFEITTGLAFKWFADEKVDVAVIETGLGGRLDSTNIITPDLSVVTSIALDHCALLGDTLEAIAGEKAGIFKEGVPAVVGEYLPETRPVFEARAAELGCRLVFAQDAEPLLAEREGEILRKMDLRGKYQAKNLRTVLAAVDVLGEDRFYSGLCDGAKVAGALVRTASLSGFHGRWERLSENPVVIADIGHNPAALKENFSQLEEMVRSGECSGLVIVYAVMADKDLEGIMPLMTEDATYIFTSPGISRALPEKQLTASYREFCRSHGRPDDRIFGIPSVREAFRKAVSLAGNSGALVYVGGSTYLVSEVVGILQSPE